MADAPIITRAFSGADSEMLQSANVNHDLLNEDLAAFTALDTTINAAFVTNYKAKIVAAESLVTDDVVIDRVAGATKAVENLMVTARNKYGEIRYFVLKVFANSPTTQNQFGLNDYEKVRRNAPKMVEFLANMFKVSTEYQASLVAGGCTATQIAEIDSVYQDLKDTSEAQEKAMKKRPKTTEDRIIALNAAYDIMTQVNAAAQIVYMNDAAKRAQFVYEPSSDSYDGPGEYEGIIAAGASVEAAHVVYGDARTLIFENTGDTALGFFLNGGGLSPEGRAVTEVAAHSVSATFTMPQLDATGNHIIVRNTSPTVAGSYKVTVSTL